MALLTAPPRLDVEYIRFSTGPFEQIERSQNISSSLILAIFQAMLLNAIGSEDVMEVVRCEQVAR